jgi:hypothetical protein
VRSTEDAGRPTRLLTDLATFTVGAPGAVLEALAPGATLDQLRARTGFAFAAADALALAILPDPPDRALATLSALDPAGLRGELVGAAT